MFDTVVVEGLKLPNLPKDINNYLKENNASLRAEFQTKDLECIMLNYVIKKDGQVYETHFKPTGKKKPYEPLAFRDNRSFLEKLYTKLKYKNLNNGGKRSFVDEVKPVLKKSTMTKTFVAGSYDEVAGRYLDVDIEFTVIAGKVIKTKLLKAELEPALKAKKRRETDLIFKTKMDASFEARRKFQSKWYYPVLKEVYNPFVFFSRLSVQAACNKIVKWTHSWHGV